MADNYGNEVSTTLTYLNKKYTQVIWQQGKPPLDSELNFVGQLSAESLRDALKEISNSGFLSDPLFTDTDYVCESNYSNLFKIKPTSAIVNGLLVNIIGVNSTTEDNIIELSDAPTSGNRTDFVFLEVWKSLISANPSTDNKPSADKVYKYGNRDYGNTDNPNEELIDGDIGFETTKRVQIQYRIRVVSDIDLGQYPDGLEDPTIFAQGNEASPITNKQFVSMHLVGDSTCWRADVSSVSTASVDGYVYAIPICAIFRRNKSEYLNVVSGGNPNHNGSTTRAITTTPRELTNSVLSTALTATATSAIIVGTYTGSAFSQSGLYPIFIEIGEGLNKEIVRGTAVNGGTSTITITRGLLGTQAKYHPVGTAIKVYNSRPDGLYADQIASSDILDLRRSVSLSGWDYQRLLQSSVSDILFNRLKTTWKQSGNGGTSNSQGLVIEQVDVLGTTSYNDAGLLDAPNGIRTTWSDSAFIQKDVTMLLDPKVSLDIQNITDTTFLNTDWEVNADLYPTGFLHTPNDWRNGCVVFFNLDGLNGGARGGLKNSDRAVRFIAPYETPNDKPIKIKFISQTNQIAGVYPNYEDDLTHPHYYMYPLEKYNYEKPFIVLGGIVHPNLKFTNVSPKAADNKLINDQPDPGYYIIDLGFDFTDYLAGTEKLLNGTETLENLLTANGTDKTGLSSELYVVVYGSAGFDNNSAFKVVGVANTGITYLSTYSATSIALLPISSTFTGWVDDTTNPAITVEFRTQRTSALDGDITINPADSTSLCVVLTELDSTDFGGSNIITSNMLVNTTLQYSSNRGATSRVPDNIHTIELSSGNVLVSNKQIDLDATYGKDLVKLDVDTHIQLWNKLGSTGLDITETTNHGGSIILGSDVDREAQCFVDTGSKTLMIRPFRKRNLLVQEFLTTYVAVDDCLLGNRRYSSTLIKDGGAVFTESTSNQYNPKLGLAIPFEYLPKFGRQDIPYRTRITGDIYLAGINHLFGDTNTTSDVFKIIGGITNGGSSTAVYPMLFSTGTTGLDYGEYGAITSGHEAYGARKVSLTNIPTNDLGSTLDGIELPPYLGFARVYGVYERANYVAKVNTTFKGAHQTDRITPITDPPINLLRTDATKYTMYIRQGGGNDVTGQDDSHTYILTSHAIDITKIPTWASGDVFDDFEYVVEATIFGFAEGFINKNNYVLVRRYNTDGLRAESSPSEVKLPFIIPTALDSNDEVYVGYTRTVYQGDPLHTKGGTSLQYAESSARYGLIPVSSQYNGGQVRGQFEANGDVALDIVNPRPLKVLSSMDFYLTLGTGKIGGSLYNETLTDVGVVSNHNIPTTSTDPIVKYIPNAFTSGVKEISGVASAAMIVFFTGGGSYNQYIRLTITTPKGTSQVVIGTPNYQNLNDFVDDINATYLVNAKFIPASTNDLGTILIEAKEKGSLGNEITLSLDSSNPLLTNLSLITRTYLRTGNRIGHSNQDTKYTKVNLTGGFDVPNDAGDGNIDISLVGLTSRLPLGILVNDSDFLCEDVLNDGTSYMDSVQGLIKVPSIQTPLRGASAYPKINGVAGDTLIMCESDELEYSAWSLTNTSGTQKYRTFRGASLFGVDGSPLTYANKSFSTDLNPVLKGGILLCKAMLVQNYDETLNTTKLSYGDELQVVIVTQAIYRSDDTLPITLQGSISPSGYGEGYASADRYFIKGRPVVKNNSAKPDTTTSPAPYQR